MFFLILVLLWLKKTFFETSWRQKNPPIRQLRFPGLLGQQLWAKQPTSAKTLGNLLGQKKPLATLFVWRFLGHFWGNLTSLHFWLQWWPLHFWWWVLLPKIAIFWPILFGNFQYLAPTATHRFLRRPLFKSCNLPLWLFFASKMLGFVKSQHGQKLTPNKTRRHLVHHRRGIPLVLLSQRCPSPGVKAYHGFGIWFQNQVTSKRRAHELKTMKIWNDFIDLILITSFDFHSLQVLPLSSGSTTVVKISSSGKCATSPTPWTWMFWIGRIILWRENHVENTLVKQSLKRPTWAKYSKIIMLCQACDSAKLEWPLFSEVPSENYTGQKKKDVKITSNFWKYQQIV